MSDMERKVHYKTITKHFTDTKHNRITNSQTKI